MGEAHELRKAVQSRFCVGWHAGGAQEVRSQALDHRPRRRSAGMSRVRGQKSVAPPPRRPAGVSSRILNAEPLEDLFEEREVAFRRQGVQIG